MSVQIWVTTQHKLKMHQTGDWNLYAEDYTDLDSFLCACKQLHADEPNPQFVFNKFETLESSELYMSALGYLIEPEKIDPGLWDFIDLDEDEQKHVAIIWDHYDSGLTVENALATGEERFWGIWGCKSSFAKEYFNDNVLQPMLHECKGYTKSIETLLMYVDWHCVARDLEQDFNFISDGSKYRVYAWY